MNIFECISFEMRYTPRAIARKLPYPEINTQKTISA